MWLLEAVTLAAELYTSAWPHTGSWSLAASDWPEYKARHLGLADGVEACEDQAEADTESEDIEQLGSSLPHGQ